MGLSEMIAIGFLGALFAMSKFVKYCRLLNDWDLEPEETKRYQSRAQRWLAAAGALLGMALLSIIAGIIMG